MAWKLSLPQQRSIVILLSWLQPAMVPHFLHEIIRKEVNFFHEKLHTTRIACKHLFHASLWIVTVMRDSLESVPEENTGNSGITRTGNEHELTAIAAPLAT